MRAVEGLEAKRGTGKSSAALHWQWQHAGRQAGPPKPWIQSTAATATDGTRVLHTG